MEHFSVVLFPTHSRTNNRVVVLTVDMQRHVFCLHIPFLLPISTVNLVELYDAAWSVCSGAAPDAAETEAAARPRQHEPATLRVHGKTHLCETWFNRRGETPQAPIGNFRHYLRVEAGDGERCEAAGSKRTAHLTDEGRAALSSPLSPLTHSVCLSPCEGVQAPDLSRCSARSRADSEGDTLSLIASSLPLGVQRSFSCLIWT